MFDNHQCYFNHTKNPSQLAMCILKLSQYEHGIVPVVEIAQSLGLHIQIGYETNGYDGFLVVDNELIQHYKTNSVIMINQSINYDEARWALACAIGFYLYRTQSGRKSFSEILYVKDFIKLFLSNIGNEVCEFAWNLLVPKSELNTIANHLLTKQFIKDKFIVPNKIVKWELEQMKYSQYLTYHKKGDL